jgi:hypothetical protein
MFVVAFWSMPAAAAIIMHGAGLRFINHAPTQHYKREEHEINTITRVF